MEGLEGPAGPGPVHRGHLGERGMFTSEVAPFHGVSKFRKAFLWWAVPTLRYCHHAYNNVQCDHLLDLSHFISLLLIINYYLIKIFYGADVTPFFCDILDFLTIRIK
jgi:hypothetical protein